MTIISMSVNNEIHMLDVEPDMPLLWALRDILGLTGTKFGCGIGLCGACTVHVDGKARRACITSVSAVEDKSVTTIEGLSLNGDHPVQQAWLDDHVPQCGYCMAGQIMTAAALLTSTPQPSDAEINSAMSDVLCRCGTYKRIRRAILRAAEEA